MIVIIALLLIASFLLGLFLLRKPSSAIELQRIFYEKINWKIEPVSLSKELRNTRIMGGIVILFCVFSLIILLTLKLLPI